MSSFLQSVSAGAANTSYPEEDFNTPFTLDHNFTMIIPPGSGDVQIPIGENPVNGFAMVIFVPGGNIDSIEFADDYHINGDVYNGNDYEVTIYYLNNQWKGVAVSLNVLDTHQPLVTSAIIPADFPDRLVVTFDRRIFVPKQNENFFVTGVSTIGGTISIDSLLSLSSNGSSSVLTFLLTEEAEPAIEYDLIINNTNLQNMNGPAIANQTVNITNNVTPALTGLIADWDANVDGSITTVSTKVSAWADQSGNGNSLLQGTDAKRPTYNITDATLNNLPTVKFTQSVGTVLLASALQQNGGALTDKDSYSVYCLVRHAVNLSKQSLFETTPTAGTLFTGLAAWCEGSTTLNQAMVAATHSYNSFNATNWYRLAFTYNSTTGVQKIYVNGAEVATLTQAANPATLSKFSLGWFVDELATYASDCTFNRVTFLDHSTVPGDSDFDTWDADAIERMTP